MVEPLKLAIVGVGRMGALHARTLAKVPETELVAVVDARPEAVRNVADDTGAEGSLVDVDNLVAILDLTGGAAAVVDLTRNARYGDDVRTEILGSAGALFVDLLPDGRTRLATARGVAVVSGSEVEDAMTAGIIAQTAAFATAVRGETIDLPGAGASDRPVATGRAVQESASRGEGVPVLAHPDDPKRLPSQPGGKVRI